MERDCVLIAKDKVGKRAIFIDDENKDEILEYLTRSDKHKKKFAYITQHILQGVRNTEVYDRENINDKCKDVTAMKFFKGGGSNDRIYCKEISTEEGVFVVIASILHEKKKSQKNSNRETTKIENVGAYEYAPVMPTKDDSDSSDSKT